MGPVVSPRCPFGTARGSQADGGGGWWPGAAVRSSSSSCSVGRSPSACRAHPPSTPSCNSSRSLYAERQTDMHTRQRASVWSLASVVLFTGEVARDLRAARIAQLEGILQVDARAKRLAPRLPAVGVEARGWGAAVARAVEHPGRDLHGEALRVSEMDTARQIEKASLSRTELIAGPTTRSWPSIAAWKSLR